MMYNFVLTRTPETNFSLSLLHHLLVEDSEDVMRAKNKLTEEN